MKKHLLKIVNENVEILKYWLRRRDNRFSTTKCRQQHCLVLISREHECTTRTITVVLPFPPRNRKAALLTALAIQERQETLRQVAKVRAPLRFSSLSRRQASLAALLSDLENGKKVRRRIGSLPVSVIDPSSSQSRRKTPLPRVLPVLSVYRKAIFY